MSTPDTLLYDGACPLCALGARLARTDGLEVRPFQAGGLPASLSIEACRGEMQWVGADGTHRGGVGALRKILRRRRWTRPAAWALALPGAAAPARAAYGIVSRNRRAIAPTPENTRLPRSHYGETAGSTAVFFAAAIGFAVLVTLAWGASFGSALGLAPGAAAARATLAAAAGWAVSLPIIMGLGWLRITCADTLRQGACVMVAGVLPLLPLAAVNALQAPLGLNLAALVADGFWMWRVMAWRLRCFGLPTWLTALWFGALEAGGITAWWLLGR